MNRKPRVTSLLILTLFLVGLEAEAGIRWESKTLSKRKQAKIDAHRLGSDQNPVRCSGQKGQRSYLDRLRCPSGSPPRIHRVGSGTVSPYRTMMDLYVLTCPAEEGSHPVSMDMYHLGFTENRPLKGFSIETPGPTGE